MKTRRLRSAGGVVLNGRGQVLVVSQHNTTWSLPKGGIEEGEDLLDAARREIYEESGVTRLKLVRGLGSYERYTLTDAGEEDRTGLKTIHLFLFETDEEELRPVDPDNPEARWVDAARVPELLSHPKDKEFFRRSYLEAERG